MGIKRLTYTLLVLFLVCVHTISNGQNGTVKLSSKTEKIDGKKFYIHKVSKGETLSAIAKAYNVNKNDIILENPEVIDGLKEESTIRIPFQEVQKSKPTSPVANENVTLHKVEGGQTLYSLSKIYSVKIDDLINANPELKDGLKKGQIIKIPGKQPEKKPEITPEPVKKENTVITGNATAVSVKKAEERPTEYVKPALTETPVNEIAEKQLPKAFDPNTPVNIGLLLPFCTNLYGLNDSSAQKFSPKNAIPLDFYQGAMLAIDSMKNKGLKAQVYVFDTANDSLQTEVVMSKPEIRSLDLIIGPLYEKELQVATNHTRRLEIPLVSPFSQSTKVPLSNPYGSKVVASSQTQTEALLKYALTAFKGQRFILVHNDSPKDKLLIEVFKKRFALYKAPGDTLVEVNILKNTIGSLDKQITKSKQNIILAPVSDPSTVSEIFNKLISFKEESISVFGMESWSSLDNIDADWLNKLNVHLPGAYFVDYSTPEVKRFVEQYRNAYKTEPSKYAFQGADVVFYYLNNIRALKEPAGLNIPFSKGLQTGFNFYKTAVESGWENRNVFILNYKDYKASLVK